MANLPYAYPNPGPFYVSPSGSDSTGTGTVGSPWATLDKALTVIRAGKLNQVMVQSDMVINFRAGTYPVSATYNFGPTDGNPIYAQTGFRLKLVSVDGPGQAIFDGSVALSGWTNVGGSIFRATLPVGVSPYTLYENGVRARAARLPKLAPGASFPMSKAPYFANQTIAAANYVDLKYLNADFDPAPWALADLQIVNWPGSPRAWMTDTHAVSARDTVNKILTFSKTGKFETWLTSAGRYYVQGVQAMLTEAGEFYVDRAGGFVYYWPNSTPIASQDIRVPVVSQVFNLAGSSVDNRCQGVVLDGLTIQNTDFLSEFVMGYTWNGTNGVGAPPHPSDAVYVYWASQPFTRLGAVALRNTNNVQVTNCHFRNIGCHAWYSEGWGRGNDLSNSLIEHIGICGAFQEGGWPGERDFIGGTTFSNCKINHMGEMAGDGAAIKLGNTGTNAISHCEFADGPRFGTWMYGGGQANYFGNVYTRGNTIDRCRYDRLCQDSGDTGALYMESLASLSGGPFNVNTITNVKIDSVTAHASMTNVVPDGVFLDNKTWNQSLQNVQVTNQQGALMRLNDTGGHTATNCSFLANGSANGAFNAGLLPGDIGVTGAFPY